MKREELLSRARKEMWAAWALSSDEIGSVAAEALIGLGMLVKPGGAQELEKLRAEVVGLKEQRERRRVRLVACEADLMEMRGLLSPNGFPRRIPAEVEIHERVAPAVEWLLGRVEELEARLAEYGRPADEDPIAYKLPDKATSWGACVACGDLPEQWCPDCAACRRGCFGGNEGNPRTHPNAPWRAAEDDVRPQVRKLRALLAGQRAAAEADGITRRIAPTQALPEATAEDPIRPCGCPKRFDRHAWGCPTLPDALRAEDAADILTVAPAEHADATYNEAHQTIELELTATQRQWSEWLHALDVDLARTTNRGPCVTSHATWRGVHVVIRYWWTRTDTGAGEGR